MFTSNSVMKDYIFEAFTFKVLSMDEMFVKSGFLGQDFEDDDDEFFDTTPQFILKDELLFLSRLKQIKEVSKENNLSVINLEEIISHTTKQIELNK